MTWPDEFLSIIVTGGNCNLFRIGLSPKYYFINYQIRKNNQLTCSKTTTRWIPSSDGFGCGSASLVNWLVTSSSKRNRIIVRPIVETDWATNWSSVIYSFLATIISTKKACVLYVHTPTCMKLFFHDSFCVGRGWVCLFTQSALK